MNYKKGLCFLELKILYTLIAWLLMPIFSYSRALRSKNHFGQHLDTLTTKMQGSQKPNRNTDQIKLNIERTFPYPLKYTKGDLELAHKFTHQGLRDSFFSINKIRQISELDIKYETERRERFIMALETEKRLDQAALKEANLQRNQTLGGIFFLLTVIGFAINVIRINKKSNRKLQEKQCEINLQNNVLKELNANQELLLIEKEWLMREIHHRVKNNLQTTISLLKMQSNYISNENALMAIENSQRRMHTMSLIHQKLYQSDDLTKINMSVYVQDLISYLADSHEVVNKVRFESETEPGELDVAQVIPLGLIINEAITNSIKYAFPGGRQGKIRVKFYKLCNNTFRLSIEDNGVGLSDNIDIYNTNTLGFNLIRGLSNQLNGELEISNTPGMCLVITYQIEESIAVSQLHKYHTA